ncbi:MAG: hypothetical protein DMF61_10550 [Blastocatellia bacterium AA13]|nr:MAG: hypothetical protein DMF61_10550 [Blastocatellia bacterium AA13]
MSEYSSIPVHVSSYQPGSYGSGPSGYQSYGTPPGSVPPQLAGIGPRIVAYLIDALLLSIILGIGYFIAIILAIGGAATNTREGSDIGGLAAAGVFLIIVPAALIVWFYNQIYLVVKNNGQTIGKKLMKVRIAKDDGSPIGYGDAFLRNLVGYWISSLVCHLGFIWALFDQQRQTWHDKIFKTRVVSA